MLDLIAKYIFLKFLVIFFNLFILFSSFSLSIVVCVLVLCSYLQALIFCLCFISAVWFAMKEPSSRIDQIDLTIDIGDVIECEKRTSKLAIATQIIS